MRRTHLRLKLLLAATMVTSCAQKQLEPYRAPLPDAPALTQVMDNPSAFQGQQIRWGGLIVHVDSTSDLVTLEIVERELDASGRPVLTGKTDARFVAKLAGNKKQWDKALGRDITIIGSIQGEEIRKNLQGEVQFIVIKPNQFHVWQPSEPVGSGFLSNPWNSEGAPRPSYLPP